MAISALLDAETFAQLDADDIDKVQAVIDAEIIRDTEIKKKLQQRLAEVGPALLKGSIARRTLDCK